MKVTWTNQKRLHKSKKWTGINCKNFLKADMSFTFFLNWIIKNWVELIYLCLYVFLILVSDQEAEPRSIKLQLEI